MSGIYLLWLCRYVPDYSSAVGKLIHGDALSLYFTPTALSAFCPSLFSLQSFIYFPSPGIVFISQSARVFPLHVFGFSIPSPQGSLLSQLTDICQWRNITTIADVEMLIPSPLSPRLPPLQVCSTSLLVLCAACSCFCPLKRPAADYTIVKPVRPLQ